MSALQKIKNYVDRTNIKNGKRYGMDMSELLAMLDTAESDLSGALCLAFEYGMANSAPCPRLISCPFSPLDALAG